MRPWAERLRRAAAAPGAPRGATSALRPAFFLHPRPLRTPTSRVRAFRRVPESEPRGAGRAPPATRLRGGAVRKESSVDFDKMHNEVLRAFNDSCLISSRQQYRGRGFRPRGRRLLRGADARDRRALRAPGHGARRHRALRRAARDRRPRRASLSAAARAASTSRSRWTTAPFERRVRLMVDVDPDSTSATYEAGVLEVRLHAASTATRRRARSRSPTTEAEA